MQTETVQTTAAGETRCRILLAARELFSRFGFFGTSVRDIAKQSQVNLAAVNYHFKNKENLLWEVIDESYAQTEAVIGRLAKNSKTFEELALGVFDHFVANREVIRNTMKLLMTDGLQPPEGSAFMNRAKKSFGPPGSLYFAEFIQREAKFQLNQQGLTWGVKNVFAPIVHWATVCTSVYIEALGDGNPGLKPGELREDARHLVRSTLFYLNAHPEIFKA